MNIHVWGLNSLPGHLILTWDIPCTFWFVSFCRSIDTAAGQWTQAHIKALQELYECQRRTGGARYHQVSSSCTITFTSTSTSTFVEVFEGWESKAFLTRSSSEDWSEILRVIGFCSVDFWSQLKVTLSLKQKIGTPNTKICEIQSFKIPVKLLSWYSRENACMKFRENGKGDLYWWSYFWTPSLAFINKKTLLWLLVR